MNYYVGVDNGASGSIGIICPEAGITIFTEAPTKFEQDYTKKAQNISRIDAYALKTFLATNLNGHNVKALIERPFMTPVRQVNNLLLRSKVEEILEHSANIEMALSELNRLKEEKIITADATFLKTSLNAHRAFEALLIVLDTMKISTMTVDSKAWQKKLLPNVSGSKALKNMSKTIGIRQWPMFEKEITKHGDADGLFIAEYCRLYYQEGK